MLPIEASRLTYRFNKEIKDANVLLLFILFHPFNIELLSRKVHIGNWSKYMQLIRASPLKVFFETIRTARKQYMIHDELSIRVIWNFRKDLWEDLLKWSIFFFCILNFRSLSIRELWFFLNIKIEGMSFRR